jgi:hypothetical protein
MAFHIEHLFHNPIVNRDDQLVSEQLSEMQLMQRHNYSLAIKVRSYRWTTFILKPTLHAFTGGNKLSLPDPLH